LLSSEDAVINSSIELCLLNHPHQQSIYKNVTAVAINSTIYHPNKQWVQDTETPVTNIDVSKRSRNSKLYEKVMGRVPAFSKRKRHKTKVPSLALRPD
jgi:hypothetical protein